MIGEGGVRKLVRQALSASEADETEVAFFGLEERLTRFANNVIHQGVAETDAVVVIRAVVDRRVGLVATKPVENLRFTQSYVEALAGAEMVGREVSAERSGGILVRAPALKLSSFNFTGVTAL